MTDLLISTVLRQKEERNSLLAEQSLLRTAVSDVKQALTNKLIKIISGPRRAGKSTLALQALEGNSYAYVNFEDEALDVSGDEAIFRISRSFTLKVKEDTKSTFFSLTLHPVQQSFR